MIEAIVVLTAIALACAWWGFSLSRRSRVPSRIGRALRATCAIMVLVPAIGVGLSARGLETTFQATQTLSPVDRQHALAAGIAVAMRASAVVVALLALEVVVLIASTIRYREKRGAQTESVKPYR